VRPLVKDLLAAGAVDAPLADRLGVLELGRDQWLHHGIEPGEILALEALVVATEMLGRITPGIVVRATPSLLYL
jgi:hypothetical protein